MFVREEVLLAVSFAAAQAGLAGVARGGWLLNASQAAYGDGVTGLAEIGLPGLPVMSKLVRVHIADVVASNHSARLPLRWEATGPGSGLFPALDADVTVTTDANQATIMVLTGVYRPPLGDFGAVMDRTILNRVASATIRGFVNRLALAVRQYANASATARTKTTPEPSSPACACPAPISGHTTPATAQRPPQEVPSPPPPQRAR